MNAVTPSDLIADIAAGNGLSLSQAARRFPSYRGGRPCSPSCLFRWVKDGVVVSDGRRVRLEAAVLCGRYLTTETAIARFIASQSTAEANAIPETPARRGRTAERAGRELDKLGF